MADIPAASSFLEPRKVGYLKKLTGKGWFYSGYWKSRYCVLDGTKLYFYEDKTSKANEKTAGAISLDYYDLCELGTAKDTKRISDVFTLGTSVRGFFDNRHLFAANSLEDCQEWIKEIRIAIDDARCYRSRAGRSKIDERREKDLNSTIQKEASFESWLEEENTTETHDQLYVPETPDQLPSITKDRVKGPTGRRLPQRRSMVPMARNFDHEESKKQRPNSLLDISEAQEEDSESEKTRSQSTEEAVEGSRIKESLSRSNTQDINSDHTISFTPNSSSVPKLSPKHPRQEKNAFLKELEHKVVAPHHRTKILSPFSEKECNDDIVLNVKNSVEAIKSRMMLLGNQIDNVERDVAAMRKDIKKVQEQIHITSENDDKITEEASIMEQRMDAILKEVHSMFEKSQEALQEAQEAKKEYYNLKQDFEEILLKIKSYQTLSPTSSVPNVTDEI